MKEDTPGGTTTEGLAPTKRLYCPECMAFVEHRVAETARCTAFLCRMCGRVEEWHGGGNINVRKAKKDA